jgi:signal transduction histidine kinase
MQMSQLEALANIGITTSMIAHEINNLLTPLANYAALALNNPEDIALSKKALVKTANNCKRATNIMQSILKVANGDNTKHNTNLKLLVDDIFNCLCRDFSKDNIKVNIDIPGDLEIYAVPIDIQQVLMNLILNARDAMLSRGGSLTISARCDSQQIEIQVADTGSGIAFEDQVLIFDPFFSTKKNDDNTSEMGGSGLGLAFCKKAVEEHNGQISVRSKMMEGTTFLITLPKG